MTTQALRSAREPATPRKRGGLIVSGSPAAACFAVSLVVSALVLLWQVAASAALWLAFDPPEAGPGQAVHARTVGQGAVDADPSTRLPVFLLPQAGSSPDALVSSVQDKNDTRLVSLGDLAVDDDGNASGTFVIPDVRAGDYLVLVVDCQPCARFSSGRTILQVGTFRVVGANGPLPRTSVRFGGGVLIAIIALAVGLVLLARTRSRRHRAQDNQRADRNSGLWTSGLMQRPSRCARQPPR